MTISSESTFSGRVAFLGELRSRHVSIGPGGGRVDEVTATHITYVDPPGQPGQVPLRECLDRLKRFQGNYVGVREALETPARVHFAWASGQVTLSFEDRDALYAQLLDRLAAVGFDTLDGC